MDFEYRDAKFEDLDSICNFVDFWLTGGGLVDKVPGCGHDFFVPRGRHEAYLKKYQVMLALFLGEIVGWAVKTKKGVLIHLLVTGTLRGSGIGSELLRRMSPETIRSKLDQSTGDPKGFYERHGFFSNGSEKQGRKKNIEILTKKRSKENLSGESQVLAVDLQNKAGPNVTELKSGRQRSIDEIKKKLSL